jgi:hypothetical protein
MAGPPQRHDEEGANPRDRPQKGEKEYITEEQVRHVRDQRPLSAHLLKKYEYQYWEEFEDRTRKSLKSTNQKTKNMNTVLGRV